MQKARRRSEKLRPLVDTRFQGLFHSLVQGSFHLSFTVLVHYRSSRSIQPYRMVPADSDRVSRAPPYSGYCYVIPTFHVRDFNPLQCNFPDASIMPIQSMVQSYNPDIAETTSVWAVSVSLATTKEITFVFSSCAYLDVSVQRVCSLSSDTSSMCRVSPFGNLRINSYLPIPAAYRSLSRPSSPLEAKASPVCPY